MKGKRQEAQPIIGAAVIVIAAVGVIVGLVFVLTGTADALTLRWWATVATLALPVAVVIVWRLATNAAREHLRGFDRGVDGAERTITSIGRGLSATASIARAVKSQPTPADYDDLLPRVGQTKSPSVGGMKIIDAPRGGDVVDL